ncbi:MAG TPA: response regulator [Alphaproteobacteria bacterium]|nr:response regulator [Alphaproteobacteria bacterium]
MTGTEIEPTGATSNRTTLRVLVVEDESLVAMMLGDMLADLGCSVIGPARNRSKALHLIAGGDAIDLVLLDVNLGGENAYEVADALEERKIPYLFVSGYGSGGIDPRYAKAPVLTKPLQIAALTRVIEAARSRPRLGDG